MVPILSGSLIRGGVVRRAIFSATGCEYFWRSQKPEVTETGMSVEHVISIANSSGGLSGLKHAENLPVMDSYSVFMKEVNNRTKTIVMSERFPEKQRRCCRCFLPDTAGNTVRSFSKRG